MKKLILIALFSLAPLALFAAEKTLLCTMAGMSTPISFHASSKIGVLPKIDFDYPVDTTTFSLRDKNLLLIAMDHEDKSRLRILISAQAGSNNSMYTGQFIIDSGGNELQLDNGPVACKVH